MCIRDRVYKDKHNFFLETFKKSSFQLPISILGRLVFLDHENKTSVFDQLKVMDLFQKSYNTEDSRDKLLLLNGYDKDCLLNTPSNNPRDAGNLSFRLFTACVNTRSLSQRIQYLALLSHFDCKQNFGSMVAFISLFLGRTYLANIKFSSDRDKKLNENLSHRFDRATRIIKLSLIHI
eukprot:TRINITY_DN23792_c0_g1_i1.p1 TRINITY_DN23792_c0_g1~~TRINITY_DN23792_c0_g1_i1.p1  ORF type:complete len:197 (-),score=19.29 TRINITY_DN23792_c0_g1_i1:60-593(-)